jgi:hypothetical protein
MLLPDLAVDSYGPATEALRAHLVQARALTWFPTLSPGPRPETAVAAANAHLTQLTELFPDTPTLTDRPLDWIEGDLTTFDALCPGLTDPTEGWGDPFTATPWGARLGQVSTDVAAQIAAVPEVLALVGPPLWPLSGRLNLVGTALYETPPPPDLRSEPRWAMLHHVQYNFHRLLDWTLLWPAKARASPFFSLFQLHCDGYYPVGERENGFAIFYRTA